MAEHNVNATGFKKSKIEFQELLYQTTRAPGSDQGNGNLLPSGLQVGQGSRPVATSKIFTTGDLTQTGEQLDIGIQGNGFFEVKGPKGAVTMPIMCAPLPCVGRVGSNFATITPGVKE